MFPFLDLAGINRRDEAALTEAFQRVLRSGWYVLGTEVAAFEAEYAAACGVAHAIGVGNGLDALDPDFTWLSAVGAPGRG